MKKLNEKIFEMIELLKNEYPDVRVTLLHSDPLELLIATILSAQCTDRQVNEVTKTLFKKYRSMHDYIAASQEELEKEIYSTGFLDQSKEHKKNVRDACK